MSAYPEKCPSCEASLVGDPIPEVTRNNYRVTYFMRVIGIGDRGLDRVVRWRCPDCGHEWPR